MAFKIHLRLFPLVDIFHIPLANEMVILLVPLYMQHKLSPYRLLPRTAAEEIKACVFLPLLITSLQIHLVQHPFNPSALPGVHRMPVQQ